MKSVIFAGGCFWGVQHYLKQVKGVMKTAVGYTAGQTRNPTYELVCSGITGHTEACRVEYDPQETSIDVLLEHFFFIIDPTLLNQQGMDVGTQYRTGVYYYHDEDVDIIKKYFEEIKEKYSGGIVVELEKAGDFWDAEDYHQDYLEKNEGGYCHLGQDKYSCRIKVEENARNKNKNI
jgi:peptide-methionine (S)-S-oxide reductase